MLRPRGRRLWHQLPAAHAGLRHQPLRPARRGHVRLHQHARLRERGAGQGEVWPPAAGGSGGRQSAGGEGLKFVTAVPLQMLLATPVTEFTFTQALINVYLSV